MQKIYDKKSGYSRWFRLLNEVACVVMFTVVVIILLLGVQYSACVGNW